VIRPTALGWKAIAFYAALWAAFFAGPYQNLFFLLLVFLAALGGLNLAWTWRNAAGVRGEVAPLPAFPAGTTAALAATLDAGRRTRFELTAVLDLSGRRVDAHADVATGRCAAAGEIAPLPRGVHAVRAAWIESAFPLGLARVRRPLAAPREIVVHPAPASIVNAPGGGLAGLAAALGASGADQPSGVRDFRMGDEVRDIHWRATARRGRPVVTEWDASVGDGLEVVLDRRAGEAALEEALSLVTALALAARESKERLTVHTQGLSRTFGAGHAPWEDLLRALALADRLPADGPPPPPAATTVLRLPLAREKVPA
jgi:uncharacterized protein (DUF58 family)